MGGELVTAEASWLEIVKSAANAEQRRDDKQRLYPSVVYPTWIDQVEDPTDEGNVESGFSDLLRPLVLKSSEDTSSTEDTEQVLLNELKEILQQSKTHSKETFLGLLGSYFRTLKAQRDESTALKGEESAGRRFNGVNEGKDEEFTLSQLRRSCKHLGQRLISLVLECSVSLSYWDPVQILLESCVVVSHSSPKLVQSLVEEERAHLLRLYTTNVPDLSPTDVYSLLTFFLDSIRNPSGSFRPVKNEWRKWANEAMEKVVKNRDAIQVATRNPMYIHVQKLSRGQDSAVSSAVVLAMAIDGFSTPELCIHHLLAAGPDEAVVSSVVSQLSSAQVLSLTRYLSKWIHCYSSHLENFPTPHGGRVPSFAQVLGWVGVVLEGHFTQLVLSSDFHSELRTMREMVHSLADFGASILPLGGMAEHIKSQRLLPTLKQHGGSTSDYVIELLDMS